MTAPSTGWPLLLWALLLGAALGVYYGFLRPLRPKHTTLSDFLFVIPALWVWVYHSFALCRGDIRLGNCVVMALGGILTDKTVGRFLRPVFFGFWHYLGVVTAFFTTPVKNFFKKAAKSVKFLLATAKKTGTIKCKNKNGGTQNGRTQSATGVPSQLHHRQVYRSGRAADVHAGAAGASLRHRGRKDAAG